MAPFYVLTFETTSHGMRAEKQARGRLTAQMIPTPREISVSCGLSLRIEAEEWERGMVEVFCRDLDIPWTLYLIDNCSEGGHTVERVKGANDIS